jgi:hypothetical protein
MPTFDEGMHRKLLQHVNADRSRHGQLRFYVRVGKGPRVRLTRYAPEDAEWVRGEYGPALAISRGEARDTTARHPAARVRAGTIEWLIGLYRASAEWSTLSPATHRQREGLLRDIIAKSGHLPVATLTPKAILAGRDKRAAKPHGANNFLKTMRGLCGWASDPARGLLKKNPVIGVKLLRGRNEREGYHTWTPAEMERFMARWPVGTRQRLAFDLLRFTSLRRSDIVRVGRQHVSSVLADGATIKVIRIRPKKTERKSAAEAVVVVHPDLEASIAATKTGDMNFVCTDRRTPMGAASFGTWFAKACVAAGVPGRSHGIRKAEASRDAENGATEAMLNAKNGWAEGSRESATYVRKASRTKLALALATQTETRTQPPAPEALGEGLGRKTK